MGEEDNDPFIVYESINTTWRLVRYVRDRPCLDRRGVSRPLHSPPLPAPAPLNTRLSRGSITVINEG